MSNNKLLFYIYSLILYKIISYFFYRNFIYIKLLLLFIFHTSKMAVIERAKKIKDNNCELQDLYFSIYFLESPDNSLTQFYWHPCHSTP